MTDDSLLSQARAFLMEDPDADTRAELAAVVAAAEAGDAAAHPDLADRYDTRLICWNGREQESAEPTVMAR